MKLNNFKVIAVAMLLTYSSLSASALYRCGNAYQDTPCKGQASSKPFKKSKSIPKLTQDNSQAQLTIDPSCATRGKAAQKIMWKREVGYTQEKQLETETNPQTRNLIVEVYKLRGSSLVVKNAIEQECAAQKEKDRLASQLEIEAARLRSGGSSAAENPSSTSSTVKTSKPEAVTKPSNTSRRDAKIALCNRLETSLEKLNVKRRKGGSTRSMNNLKQEQNKLQSQLESKECL